MYGAAAADMRLRKQEGKSGPAYGVPTILAAACADALMSLPDDAFSSDVTATVTEKLKEWARRHPEVGFGRDFDRWERGEKEALSAKGAMSVIGWVSSAGWLYSTLERTQDVARAVALAVSSDPEVLRATQCMASLIFLGRMGRGKAAMLDFSHRAFGYALNAYVDALCDGRTIYIDALDMPYVALSLYSISKPNVGGEDLDPFTAAACGCLLEADGTYPDSELQAAARRMPDDCRKVFEEVCKPKEGSSSLGYTDVSLSGDVRAQTEELETRGNLGSHCDAIEDAISLLYSGGRTPHSVPPSKAGTQALEDALVRSIHEDGQVLIAWDVAFTEPDKLAEAVRHYFLNGLVQYYEGVRATVTARARTTTVRVGQKPAVAVFTGSDIPRNARTIRLPLKQALLVALETPGADGIILNPFGQSAPLGREAVLALLAKAGVDTEDEWTPHEEAHPSTLDDLDPLPYAGNDAILDAAMISPGPDDLRFGVLSQSLASTGPSPVARALMRRAREGGKFILGYKISAIPSPEMERLAHRALVDGDRETVLLWTQVLPVAVSDDDGNPALVAFTKPEEARQWEGTYRFAEMDIVQMMGIVERMDDNVGLCLDPFGVDLRLDRPEVLSVLEMIRTGQHM